MNAYDWALFRRALLAIVVLSFLTSATVVATDEATSTAATRMARLSALAPLIVAVALLGVGAHARARGELRAIEALGTAPWRSLRGAERAGVLIAAVSLLVLMAPFTDATSLLPAVRPLIDWTLTAGGDQAVAPGLVVHASGAIEATHSAAEPALFRHATWAAFGCVAPLACLVPPWAATPMSSLVRLSSGVFTALFAVVALHLVAAARISPWLAALASVPIALALWRSRR
jgi:hypothetical protein